MNEFGDGLDAVMEDHELQRSLTKEQKLTVALIQQLFGFTQTQAEDFVRYSDRPEVRAKLRHKIEDLLVSQGLSHVEASSFVDLFGDASLEDMVDGIEQVQVLIQKKGRRLGGRGMALGSLPEAKQLLEGVVSAKQQYVETGKLGKLVFDKLVTLDPTTQKKYIDWMSKVFVNSKHRDSDLDKYTVISDYDKLVTKNLIQGENRDINRFKSIEQVYDLVKTFEEVKTKGEERREKKEGADVVFENDKVLVVKPRTKDASCFYGAGTRWCTSATQSGNYFNDYYYGQEVTLYYVLPKTDEFEKRFGTSKLAVAVYSGGKKEIYNDRDEKISTNKASSMFTFLGVPF